MDKKRFGLFALALAFALTFLNGTYAMEKTMQPKMTNGHEQTVQILPLTTPKGITVWLVESHQLPMVSVEVAFRAGSAYDPKAKEGLAGLTASLMDEGAGKLDSTAFKEALDDIGAIFGGSAGITTASVDLTTLSQHKDEAFNLLGMALQSPRFDEEAVERVKDGVMAGIQRREENPSSVAQRLFRENLLLGHPYGHMTEGNLDSVTGLTRDDAQAFYQQYYTRANMVVSVVGDITPDEVIKLVDKHLAPLPEGVQVAWPEAPKKVTPAIVRTKREVPQSSIMVGRMGIGRGDSLYFPVLVMNEVLGGGVLTSRLFTEVREKHGLAYDVRSVNVPLPGGGLYYAAVQTNNQTAEKALGLMRSELERMRTKGVDAEELQDIKDYLIGSFPLRLDSNSKILGYLTMMQTEGLGLTYLDDWIDAVKAVTAEDVLKAGKVLDFSESVLVIVGDGPALELK